jgi:hypothetical protein
VILFDILIGHNQHMWIMNVVWPITGLWAGPIALWAYFKFGTAIDSSSSARWQTPFL